MAPPIDNVLQLGFRFEPTPKQAVTYYLPRLIAGEPMHAAIRPFIHHADIYACEPGVLAAQFWPTPGTGDRFFFTPCKLQPQKAGRSSRAVRTAGHGSWQSQGNSTDGGDVRDGAGVKIGEVKKLRYRKKGGAYTDWLMDEFSCCSEGSVVDGTQYVLCKIYVSPRAGPASAARKESDAAIFAPLPPPDLPVAAPNKRPAPPVAEPPRPKRIRGAVIPPTPPIVQPPPSLSLVQALAPQHWSPQPCIQTSTMAQAASAPVSACDPFCTESLSLAQDNDDGCFDFAEGTLP